MGTEDGYIMIDPVQPPPRRQKRGSRSQSRSRKAASRGDVSGAAGAAMAAMLFAMASGEDVDRNQQVARNSNVKATKRAASVPKKDAPWLSQQSRGRRSSTVGPRQQHQHRSQMSRGPRR